MSGVISETDPLERLMDLEKAATPGPWTVEMSDYRKDEVARIACPDPEVATWLETVVQSSGSYCDDTDPPCSVADADLIVAARNALPALLEAAEALQAVEDAGLDAELGTGLTEQIRAALEALERIEG